VELENKNRELERSNANLEEFTHIASHDLKEPMRKIHFFTDRLKMQLAERISEEEKNTFSRIENANNRMVNLIDDLLLYSRFSQRPPQMEKVDLNEKISKVLEDLIVDIQQKKAVITIRPLPTVKGYHGQLQQLFQNLIGNALKYHQEGLAPSIDIFSTIVNGDDIGYPLLAKPYYAIEVRDKGIGFEPEHAEKIFQMFQRLHGNAEYRGTGVGLAIARKVADNHHGRIIAQSELGKGSRFVVYLPV
jgi:light-regulated signal transduction histidine kinase (bacteriophytochrome)